MKSLKTAITLVCILAIATAAYGRERSAPAAQPNFKALLPNTTGYDARMNGLLTSQAVSDTTWLGSWGFETPGGACDAQGWVRADITVQIGDFFHVDDFAGLGGGVTGRLIPIDGNQSLWCGARPSPTGPLCGYAALPGYGNAWDQAWCTSACLTVDSMLTIDYTMSWDTEPGYDYITVEVDACDDMWQVWDGGYGIDGTGGPTVFSNAVSDDINTGQMRVRFRFKSDGAWSDEDGLWSTDGAAIVDNLSISDKNGYVLAVEDFEGESVGDTDSDDWESCTPPGYGDFAGLYNGITMVQEDRCNFNGSCLWSFVNGSTYDYSCGGYPAQMVVPYENQSSQYISNEIWSPTVPWIGAGTTANLEFDVYRDLPLSALVFFVWHVRSYVGGCAGDWRDLNFVYYGDQKDWFDAVFPIGGLIEQGTSDIQVAIGTIDMCGYWCGIYGDGQCHSHSPLIDNVDVYRIDTHGPVWTARDIDMFQVNFPADGTITGPVRADMAQNTNNWGSSQNIIPGDSAVVEVDDPDFGLKLDPYTGTASAVYCYVSVWPQNQPGKSGNALTEDPVRWPVVATPNLGGVVWTQIRCDSTLNSGGYYNPINRFSVDLNDNLFTPGDTVCFFFRADSDAPSTDVTYWSRNTGTTSDINEVLSYPMEFTCLPAGGYLRGGDILYVDDFDGRGAQPFFDTAFQMMGLEGKVDRYDTRGPSSIEGNSLGGRVTDVFQQVIGCYRKIIWNTGDLSRGTIGDGSGNPDYADDAGLLYTFLNHLNNTGGLYLSGDDLADELSGLSSGSALSLKSYINYNLIDGDHVNQGVGISPLAVGEPGSIFTDIFGPDSLVAFGGCPIVNDFDVIEQTGTATLQASYHGNYEKEGAVVAQASVNASGFAVGVVLSGFSYHYIRDTRPAGVPARVEHLRNIITWLGNLLPQPVGGGAQSAAINELSQNYPNPFNPHTMIKYQIKETGPVSLRIYNVAGQLVRMLVDEESVRAGELRNAEWRGLNDAGQPVSSGVYFYKLVATNYTQTKKMVLLK